MMLNFIDISSYQATLNLVAVSKSIQGVIIKATEGTNYVNPYCDRHYQQAKKCNLLRGFYHFAGTDKPEAEAEYFWNNCRNYFRDGIPILDWEGDQSVDWVNRFVRHLKDISGIWCWIYANPWRFNQGGVEPNCARWVASYPAVSHPTFTQAANWNCPDTDGNVVAWQFCSDGRLNGYGWNLDCSLYYGDKESWLKYAGADASDCSSTENGSNSSAKPVTLSGNGYKVTIERT
jgi:GH25 family lysozyme M1 (1,4-beta-N-acetylmuramidase)